MGTAGTGRRVVGFAPRGRAPCHGDILQSMAERRPSDRQLDGAVLIERRVGTRRPRMYRVLLHNDDYTTMEFVVAILVSCFHRSRTDAVRIMLEVHHQGIGVAGVFPREVAEVKVAEATAAAQSAGMPLLVTAEPEADDDDDRGGGGGGGEGGDDGG